MLRFFRTLRQRLLAENRFSKYLLYAVGEIALVVIGILIALSIDAWNSQRIDETRITAYYDQLSGEFEGIGNSVRNSLKKNDSIIADLDVLLEIFRTEPPANPEKLITRLPTLYEVPDIHIVTLLVKEFADSGLFSKLSNDPKRMIVRLILDIEEINRQDVWAKEQHISNIEPFLLRHLSYKLENPEGKKDNGQSLEIPDSFEELMGDQEFRSIVKLKRNTHERIASALTNYTNDLSIFREFVKNK